MNNLPQNQKPFFRNKWHDSARPNLTIYELGLIPSREQTQMEKIEFNSKYVSTLEASAFNSLYNTAKPLINSTTWTTDWEQMFRDDLMFEEISLYLKTARPAAILSLIEIVTKMQNEIDILTESKRSLEQQIQYEQDKFEHFQEKTLQELQHWRNQCELYQEKEQLWATNDPLYGVMKMPEGK